MATTTGLFRPIFAALAVAVVCSAVFVLDRLRGVVSFAGHSLFGADIDHRTRLHVDSMERQLRAETLELTSLGERFRAFIRRRHSHRLAFGDGYVSGEAGWLPAH